GDADGSWPVGFTRYLTNGGLPDDLVFTIAGDDRGRLWFGTLSGAAVFTPDPALFGLGAFDPSHWQTFTTGNSPLANDKVHSMTVDHQGRVWLGTERGISVIEDTGGGQLRW